MPKHQLCRNCGHEIDHNYCPACGQRTTTDRLTWASLVDSVSSTFIGDEAYGLLNPSDPGGKYIMSAEFNALP